MKLKGDCQIWILDLEWLFNAKDLILLIKEGKWGAATRKINF